MQVGVDVEELVEAVEAQWAKQDRTEVAMICGKDLWRKFGLHDAICGWSFIVPEGSA
jgi:hypothetical protein